MASISSAARNTRNCELMSRLADAGVNTELTKRAPCEAGLQTFFKGDTHRLEHLQQLIAVEPPIAILIYVFDYTVDRIAVPYLRLTSLKQALAGALPPVILLRRGSLIPFPLCIQFGLWHLISSLRNATDQRGTMSN